jgi:threonine/homoserine/homoserine lactone efflux protein
MLAAMSTLLAAVDFAPIIQPVLEVLNAILFPALAIVGAVGTIYCVFLGIKMAKSDEQNSREKAKKDLIGAIIGFILVFVLIVSLKIAMPILIDWVRSQI